LSKNKRVRQQRQDPPEKPIQKPAPRGTALDTFQNALARLGMTGSPNMLAMTEYPISRLSRDYNLLNALYRNSWIIKRIINTIPEDMCKNWYDNTAELTPEQTDRIKKLEERTHLKDKITKGLYWGRLYGGAGGIMMIKGHEDLLNQPLDIDDVMPNSFKGLMIVDRWSGIFPSSKLVTDIDDPEFGLPEWYDIKDLVNNQVLSKVHHSRVIRFVGRELPTWENEAEMQWGASEVEHVFEELAKHDNTSWNIAALVFQANLLINKVDGMDQLAATTDPQMQQNFYNIKSAQNQMRNNNGMMVIGDKESIDSIQYTFSGLDKILEEQMYEVAGAAEMPVTRLFGRAPAGLNATGESDDQYYNDRIGQEQESKLKPALTKLMPVIFMSEFGHVPDDLGVKFNPAQTPTEDKMAELVGKKVTSIVEVFNAGIINQKIALQELHELSYNTDMFTSITDEDIEKADDSFGQQGEFQMPGMATVPQNESENDEQNVYSNAMDGGEGSGNFGHEGRPGKIGGSTSGGTKTGEKGYIKLDEETKKCYNNTIIGLKTGFGRTVEFITDHTFKRVAQRGISADDIAETLKNPTVVTPRQKDKYGNSSFKVFGKNRVVVAFDPDYNAICSVWWREELE
jgi:phage-related protein (TIGR01555 family)